MGNIPAEPGHHLVAIRRSPEEWESILKDFEDSGMSLASFCAERGISPKTASSWRRRLRQDPGDGAFVPIRAPEPSTPGWEVELELGGGAVLRLRRR